MKKRKSKKVAKKPIRKVVKQRRKGRVVKKVDEPVDVEKLRRMGCVVI